MPNKPEPVPHLSRFPGRDLSAYPHAHARPATRSERRRLPACYRHHDWGDVPHFSTDVTCRTCGQHWSRGANTNTPFYACTCPPGCIPAFGDRGEYAMIAPTDRWPGSKVEAHRRRRPLTKNHLDWMRRGAAASAHGRESARS